MEVMKRREAKLYGLKTYYTGKPCQRGNIAQRLTINGACLCDNCKNFRSDKNKKWQASYSEEQRDRLRKYRLDNRDKLLKNRRDYYHDNKENHRVYRKKYELNNMDKVISTVYKRQEAYKNSKVWYREIDEFVERQAYSLAKIREEATGFKWSVDHMIPLIGDSVCGLTVWNNIQVIPLIMNLSKRNGMLFTNKNEWLDCLVKTSNFSQA